MVYYNEIEASAAAWLRELIKEKLISPGDVDERSIEDVQPADVMGYTQCHWFAGIGVWSYALGLAGWPENRPVWTGSCHCPSFSAAGKGGGFNDPRHLWPSWVRLIRECRPSVVFGEQADDAIGYGWLDLVQSEMEAEGYAVGKAVLGACSVGAPHIRQRLYFVADTQPERRRGRDNGDTAGHGGPLQAALRRAACVLEKPGQQSTGLRNRRPGESDCSDGSRASSEPKRSGNTSSLGHSGDGDGQISVQQWGQESSGMFEFGRNGRTCTLDYTERGEEYATAEGGLHAMPSRACAASGLGDANESGPQGRRLSGTVGEREGGGKCVTGPAGPVSGFWRDAEWLPCRDGKARAAKPGIFPLAYGPAGRVGLLRGAGNAIVPQVAQAFIESYIGTLEC